MNLLTKARQLAVAMAIVVSCATIASAKVTAPSSIGSSQVNNSGSATVTITTTQAVPAGGSILVGSTIEQDSSNPTAVTCTDTAGNSYNTDASLGSDISFTVLCSTQGLAAPLAAGATITLTFSGGSGPTDGARAEAFAVTGLMASPLEQVATGSSYVSAFSATLGVPTSQADELLFAVASDEGSSGGVTDDGFTPGTNGTANACKTSATPTYTVLDALGTINPGLFAMQCIVSATGTYAASATVTDTAGHIMLLAAYKAVPPPPVPSLSPGALAGLGALLFGAGLLFFRRRARSNA